MHWGLAGCLFLLFQELSLCSLEHGGLTVVRLHEWSQSSRSQLQEFSRPSTRRPQMPHSTDRATTKGQPGLRGGQGGCCLKRPTSHSWHWPRQWPGGPKLPGQQAEDKLLSIDSCWFVKQKEKWVPFRWICSVCDIYIYIYLVLEQNCQGYPLNIYMRRANTCLFNITVPSMWVIKLISVCPSRLQCNVIVKTDMQIFTNQVACKNCCKRGPLMSFMNPGKGSIYFHL